METIDRWRNQLLDAVADARLLGRPRRVERAGEPPALEGTLTIAGRTVTVAVIVDPLLKNRLPVVQLRSWDALGFIPHVGPNGVICYLDPEGMLLDRRRELDIIRECIEHVRRTLQAGVTGANQADFVNEFEVYWCYLRPPLVAISSLEPIDEAAEVVVATSPTPGAPLRLAADARGIMHIADNTGSSGPWAAYRAIYLPLEPDTLLIPPRWDQPFWMIDDIRELLGYCSESNRAQLAPLIAEPARDPEYLVIGLPRPAGGRALFGVRLSCVGEQHPLAAGGSAAEIRPIRIERRDRSFLVQRGGGQMDLETKRVLLLGCGSVGSHLSVMLAQAGLGQLTLVDHDILKPENTYRHVLGRPYWGRSKAQAMRERIATQLPFCEVGSICERVEDALTSGQIQLDDFDLIISALGNPTAELALNERVRREAGPPIIFAWLEPLGVGGHAVLTGRRGEPGCFACLYGEPDPEHGLQNRAAFGEAGQTYARSLAGCSSLYTPYGALDATRTAELAARLAIGALDGTLARPTLRSWKGDASAYIAAKLRLSARYDWSEDDLNRRGDRYPDPSCLICGGRRG